MENLTVKDIQVLRRLESKILPPPWMTDEEYRGCMYHLAELELILIVYDIGGFILDFMITDKGYDVLYNNRLV